MVKAKEFRQDINGLRALAVLAVILFHFNPSYLPGGFSGVDVFFVISGYLMTVIIINKINNNNFNILDFLKSRATRILPALAFVTTIIIFFGFILLEPSIYKDIGKHATSSLLFISNIIYNRESGYFDVDSHSKFLLHTWSLSVEWQFYIIYPIVLSFLSKFLTINKLKLCIVSLFFLSLTISIIYSDINVSSSYFLLYSRAWEMLAGALAFFYPFKRKNTALTEISGILLILFSLIYFSEKTIWPGYNALIPVTGAYLCISACNTKTILSNKCIQLIGILSYSIYLIHWPLIIFLERLNISVNIFIFLLITLMLSLIIYITIEKRRHYGYGSLCVYVFLIVISYSVYQNGYRDRIDGEYIDNFHRKYYGGEGIQNDGSSIRFNKDKKVEFILIGDSLARQYANFFNSREIGFIGIFKDGCFSSEDRYLVYFKENKESCIARYQNLLKSIKEYDHANIIIAQRWDESIQLKKINSDIIDNEKNTIKNIEDYIHSVSKKINPSRKIFILGLAQGTKSRVFECIQNNKLPFYKYFNPKNCYSTEKRNDIIINNKIKNLIHNIPNTDYIDINEFICEDKLCNVTDIELNPLYSDDYHFSIYGAKKVGAGIYEYIYNKKP